MNLNITKFIRELAIKAFLYGLKVALEGKGYGVERLEVISNTNLTRIGFHFDTSVELLPIEAEGWLDYLYDGKHHLLWSTNEILGSKPHADSMRTAVNSIKSFVQEIPWNKGTIYNVLTRKMNEDKIKVV